MGVVHEGAGFGQVELVDKGLARFDPRMAQPDHAIHARGQDQPVPVDGCVFWQFVGDINPHTVAFDRFDRGAGGLAVIPPQMRDHAVGQFAFYGFRDKVEFLDAVVHAVGQRPAVQRDHGRVIHPRRGARRDRSRSAVHMRRFRQPHVQSFAPRLRGHKCRPRRTGTE